MSRFLRQPPSIRLAASVIVTATTLVVVGAGALMRIVDHREYSSIWLGMWWALQTVTTIGYGDVTPKNLGGRLVAAFVMLEGVAFIAIITAAITSTFVARAEHERGSAASERMDDAEPEPADTRFGELLQRFDRLEALLQALQRPERR